MIVNEIIDLYVKLFKKKTTDFLFLVLVFDVDFQKNTFRQRYLRSLIQLMAPEFYEHVQQQQDGHYLLFCHRWILL